MIKDATNAMSANDVLDVKLVGQVLVTTSKNAQSANTVFPAPSIPTSLGAHFALIARNASKQRHAFLNNGILPKIQIEIMKRNFHYFNFF